MNADYLEIRKAYLAHYKTKGAKKGIRRFQSYEVAPNPSGYVGQEVGEAAKQAERVGDDDEKEDDFSKYERMAAQYKSNLQDAGSFKPKDHPVKTGDPKKQIADLNDQYGKLTDEFTKKHPKVKMYQFDDWELIDMYLSDPSDPESKVFMKEYGFDASSVRDYNKMRDQHRSIDKQIRELKKSTKKKGLFSMFRHSAIEDNPIYKKYKDHVIS